jgi:hypothetical protein
MIAQRSTRQVARRRWRLTAPLAAAALAGALVAAAPASGAVVHVTSHWARHGWGHGRPWFQPGNLVVSGSNYVGTASLFTPGVTELPPGCVGSACTPAVADGTYPGVFNNDASDGSFGITSPIFLDQITPDGHLVNVLHVPDGTGSDSARNHIVTSFSSKSELALHLSTNGQDISFMGYYTQPNAVDVSNSNTPGDVDPTNPVAGAYYRVAAEINKWGKLHYTLTNAYSGNNGRSSILNNSDGNDFYYAAGNAGNGNNPQPAGIILGAGAQFIQAAHAPESAQSPGQPTPVGSFNITQLGDKADKTGKDTNFRGIAVYNNVVYFTKGSGGNGVNTVYFVDTTGNACPNGTGLPEPGAQLPTAPINISNPTTIQTDGVQPYNMCILQGFPTLLAKSPTGVSYPFGLWFASKDTLYVADEGDGSNTYSSTTGTYTDAAAQTTAGLQKWVFNGTSWNLAYTLSTGLDLGTPYAVPGYPTGDNSATGLPWAAATDGLRNLTGRVNPNGTVTIWAITSTVSGAATRALTRTSWWRSPTRCRRPRRRRGSTS